MRILVPVLHRAKEQGKNIVCRSDLHQVGLAANLYVVRPQHKAGPARDGAHDGLTSLTECTVRASTVFLADNENGKWRQIIKSAADPGTDRCDVWNPGHLPSSNSEDLTLGRRVARARHKNGCNLLFLDWHVDWMPASNITVEMWRFER